MKRITGKPAMSPTAAQVSPHMQQASMSAAQAGVATQLSARVAALEAAVRELQAHAVLQETGGGLQLPDSTRFRVQLGRTCLQMDIGGVLLEAGGRVLIDSRGGSSTQTTPSSSGGIQQAAASPSNWQTAAAQGGVDNPLNLPPGTRI